MAAARLRQRALTKPLGSLGVLERLHAQLAGILRGELPSVERPWMLVMAADHGVTAEGVSAYPRRVTGEMVRNFLAGGAAINVLARDAGARLLVVDMGVDWPDESPPTGICRRPLGRGTANMTREPAMSRQQAIRGLEIGVEIARQAIADGADTIALGEMGIGNTTASAAIIAALSGQPARAVTGLGTGLDRAGWERKVRTIERALAHHRPRSDDPVGALAAVGGFEIAGLAGAIIGGATARVPVVLDGLIVAAAALVAVSLCPATRPYLIASHRSPEPGHRVALEYLELEPLMDMGLRLGEGSGAAVALHLLRLACRLPREMATFDEAGVARQSHRPSDVGAHGVGPSSPVGQPGRTACAPTSHA
jgi:nicotinate-nucleotide--dimethylbenzimidazole phosphoribosyltransferase